VPTAEDNSVIGDKVAMAVNFAWNRPWVDQWWVALWWAVQMERCYSGPGVVPNDTSSYRLIANETCAALTHVADWAETDVTNPLDKTTLRNVFDQSEHLKLARVVANTAKHRERSNPNATAAQVVQVTVDVDRDGVPIRTVTIRWQDSAGQSGTVDALELVQGALAEWRAVFVDNEIADPYPGGL